MLRLDGRVSVCVAFFVVVLAITTPQKSVSQVVPSNDSSGYKQAEKPQSVSEDFNVGQFRIVQHIPSSTYCITCEYSPPDLRENRLSWTDTTGAVGFTFIDNGYTVLFEAKAGDGHKASCLTQNVLIGYDPKPSTVTSWTKLQPFIIQQVRACDFVKHETLRRLVAEMRASDGDYIVAANKWKTISRNLFGADKSRCISRLEIEQPAGRLPSYKCTRYSVP